MKNDKMEFRLALGPGDRELIKKIRRVRKGKPYMNQDTMFLRYVLAWFLEEYPENDGLPKV